MITNEFINQIMLEIQQELNRQTEFIASLKNHNQKLEADGSRTIYSLDELAGSMEQNLHIMRKTLTNLPTEEDLVD